MKKSIKLNFLIKQVIGIIITSVVFGGVFSTFFFGLQFHYMIQGMLTGLLISITLSIINIFIFSRYLKLFSLPIAMIIHNVTYTLVFAGSIILIGLIFKNEKVLTLKIMLVTLGFSFGLSFIFSSLIDISRLLGRRAFKSFLTGKYHQPKQEEIIFMFLDIKNSTGLAEKLGDKEFLSLLDDFYTSISEAILLNQGEIYKYIGDEVIIVWDIETGIQYNSCVECFFEINEVMNKHREEFLKKYNVVPEYRAGLHAGKVTIGELGYFKAEIAFMGNVVNTTARIMEECRIQKKDLLISADLLEKLDLTEEYNTQNLGLISLRGKQDQIRLFSISR